MSNPKHVEPHGHEGHEHEAEHGDDLIVVPKGKSKLLFFLTLGLMLFVLFIFTVGSQVIQTCSGQQQLGSETYLSWSTPGGGEKQISSQDYLLEKRSLSSFLGLLSNTRSTPSDEQTAYWIVLDDVARDAGVEITDKELADWILSRFGSGEVYHQILGQVNETPKHFESVLRRQMRFERYRTMLAAAAMQFDPVALEKTWKGQHQQHRFEYVELAVDDLKESASAELPGDEELRAWFEGLDEPRKQAYLLPAAVTADMGIFLVETDADTSALLQKYPGAPVEDMEAHALDYYQGFAYARFPRDKPDLSGPVTLESLYQPYEEVKDVVLAEVPIYDALTAWNASLVERAVAGAEIDFAAEARELGLAYETFSEPMTVEEWVGLGKDWAGRFIGNTLTAAEPGFLPAPVVERKALLVARVQGKLAERQPAFAEVQARVADEWITERARELALERLEALRDPFGTRPPSGDPTPFRPEATSERFAETLAAAGYQVMVRDWQERLPSTPIEKPTPADEFFRTNTTLYAMPVGSVAPPAFDRTRSHAFLARVAGVRDPEGVEMAPKDVASLRQAQETEAARGFEQRTFVSQAFMKKEYGMWFKSWDEGAATDPGATDPAGSPR